VPNAEVQQLIKEVRRNGFAVEIGDGGVGKVLWKGEQVYKHEQDGGTPVTIHSTPSDHRWRKNIVPILIRAKVLESDPFSSHPTKKFDVTPETAKAFLDKQLKPWIQRRYDEGFTQAVLANAIITRWPDLWPTQNTVAVAISKIVAGKQTSLTGKKYQSWKQVVDGWSKQPVLPPARKEPKPGTNGSATNGHAEVAGAAKQAKQKLERPSIPLSARCLAMMMDSYPDRDEALLLHLELVEIEERVYA
jgi:hypothetical protein